MGERPPWVDLRGRTFRWLTVVRRVKPFKWQCVCKHCGKECIKDENQLVPKASNGKGVATCGEPACVQAYQRAASDEHNARRALRAVEAAT